MAPAFSQKQFKFKLKWLDLANPLSGFILGLIFAICMAVLTNVSLGLYYPVSILAVIIILFGTIWYIAGIFIGNFLVKKIYHLERHLQNAATIFSVISVFIGIFFFLASASAPWQLDLMVAISIFILFILLPDMTHEFIARIAIELGLIFLALSIILFGIVPTLTFGFFKIPGGLSDEISTSLIFFSGFVSLVLGSTLLMAGNKSWGRIWGGVSALLGVLLLYWFGIWYFIAAFLITILTALRCFDFVNIKEELIVFSGVATLLLLIAISPFRSYLYAPLSVFPHLYFSLTLVIKSSNLLVGTTSGGVIFGIPDGRILLLQTIYQKLGGTWRGGGLDATIFGAPLMDFGIIGIALFMLFLGFILSIGYKAVNLAVGDSKKIIISAYAVAYAFSIIDSVRGPDLLLITLLIALLAVSFSTLSEAVPLQNLPLITPEMHSILSTLQQTGNLMYSLLFDDDKKTVGDLQKMGFVKVERNIVKITSTGRRAFEALEEESKNARTSP